MLTTSAANCTSPITEVITVNSYSHVTATSGQLTVITEMSFNKASYDRKRFFDAATYGRLKEVIELSCKFSNDVEVLSEALYWSCKEDHLDVVKWLEGHTTADVNFINSEVWLGYTPLTAACNNDHLDIVKYLVETYHADVNLPDNRGDTSLTEACRSVSMSVSMYLLNGVSDLDVNIADRYGNTALHYAVWCCEDNDTQLHLACYRGDVNEVLRLVYVKGHKINVQNNDGDTPLHYACYKDHCDIGETLMLAGADETITNDRGMTPAQVADIKGHGDLLRLLNRDSLWQVMLDRRKKMKLSLVVLTMLTVTLIRQRQMTGKWCHTFTVVHIMLIIRSIIDFNFIYFKNAREKKAVLFKHI